MIPETRLLPKSIAEPVGPRGVFSPLLAAAAALRCGALAIATKGYSGAEIAGLMRSAASFALERYVDDALLRGWKPGTSLVKKQEETGGRLEVTFADLRQALREVEAGTAGPRRRFRRLGRWRQARTLESLTRKAMASAGKAAE